MRLRLKSLLTGHPLAAFFVLLFSGLIFGLSSYNLFFFFKANFELIAENGLMALADGAARQFFELCGYGLVSSVSYVIFKASENVLVDYVLK